MYFSLKNFLYKDARRIGESTIAKQFAKKEYKSHIIVDFANASDDIIYIPAYMTICL